MIALGEHAEFIIAAYIGVYACIGALVFRAVYATRKTKARLIELGDNARPERAR